MSRGALIVAFVAVRVAFAQASPEMIGPAEDASALLGPAREKVLDSIHRLPKYTCLETIDRAYYALASVKHRPHMMTEVPPATACIGNGAGHLSLAAKDRVRVEVAAAGGGEIHSWPGASRFDTRPFDQMISFGPLSTGSFGTSLLDVFTNPGAQIKLTGRNGDVFEYSFRVPLKASHFNVKGSQGWQLTAFSGSFKINAASATLVRLVLETDLLPRDTGMCQASISTDYRFMPIGDGVFLIPRQSEFETSNINGEKTDSLTKFSGCREYAAESSLRFDDQDTSAAAIKTKPHQVTPLPPGVSLILSLVGPLDLGTAAAGDPISARVVDPVRARGSKEVLVHAGAIARGRILEMRHLLRASEFLISVRFDSLETKGAVLALSLRLAREIKAERRTSSGLVDRGIEFTLPAPASSGGGSLFRFPAKTGVFVIPDGYRSKWITVAP
jgi:hypothetical protein